MSAPSTDAAESESGSESDTKTPVRVGTASAIWVLIAGVLGLTAAITLTVEKIELLIDPSYVPSCSINPVLS
ncbi:MAG: hypothetical protein QOJ28_3465, partial [Mycobacterium sp.]|nr:hypothetical protein [Mycobacterium sp.]